MPYEKHSDFNTPAEDTILWRYMDLPKFLVLLEQRSLYFTLRSELEDSWEFVLSRDTTHRLAMTSPAISGNLIQLYGSFLDYVGVNCWYRGDGESVAMWHLYTKSEFAVAVRTTVGRLKRALHQAEPIVIIGSVRYEDHTDPVSERSLQFTTMNALYPAFQKRTCFKHECEVRAVTYFFDSPPVNETLGTSVVVPKPERGRNIPVSLEELVLSVTTGPHFPTWALRILKSALERAGLQSVEVAESNAFKPPEARFLA